MSAFAGVSGYHLPTEQEIERVRVGIAARLAARNARDAVLADRLDALACDAHAIAGELRGRSLLQPGAD
jgi:hypothetical protein